MKLNLKNKPCKQHLLVGLLIGVVSSAFAPDKFNPAIILQNLKNKNKG